MIEKKIMLISLYCNPKTQGGIQTFNRGLKTFYPKDIILFSYKNRKSINYYDVEDVNYLASDNILFKIANRIFKDKLRKTIVEQELKKYSYKYIVFSMPYEVLLLKNLKSKKILVQHLNYEKYISNFCKNDLNYIEAIRETIDYLVVLSKYDAEKFKNGFKMKDEQIKVIRHTSTIPLLKEKKERKKELIMITRIELSQKRIDLAIKAMKQLEDFTLNIYGKESNNKDMEILKKIIREENLKNVNFCGVTNNVKEKLDQAGIFIMTSDHEGYPISTIEAMRRGLPLVLRNTFDSARDIVIDNGILLEEKWDENKFVEAVREIYRNYEYYSENSKKLGERHSKEVIKKEWDKLLRME